MLPPVVPEPPPVLPVLPELPPVLPPVVPELPPVLPELLPVLPLEPVLPGFCGSLIVVPDPVPDPVLPPVLCASASPAAARVVTADAMTRRLKN